MLLQIAAGLAHAQIILTKSEPIKDFDYVLFTNQTICLCLHWIMQIIKQHGRDQTMYSPQRSVTRRSSMIANEVQGWEPLDTVSCWFWTDLGMGLGLGLDNNECNVRTFLLHLSEDVSCAINFVRLAWKLYKCPCTNKVIIWWRYTKQNFDKKKILFDSHPSQ